MLTLLFMRMALWAMCVVLGSLGVFLAIVSFRVPAVSSDALVFLAAGLGINYFLVHEKL